MLPITGFHRDAPHGVDVTHDFRDPAQAAAFTEAVVAFAGEHRPSYLGIGNEVNRVAEDAPEAFAAWAEALPELVAAIKAASPQTQILVTFQYEFLLGEERVSGRARTEDWSTMDRVAPHVDVVGFTTYPYFTYADPDDVPADYYHAAVERSAGRPVAFTEMGWPSAPIGAFEGTSLAELGGTPEEQAAFIRRLPGLLDGVDPVAVMWVGAYDTPAGGDLFASLGLHEGGGEEKPALTAWEDFLAARRPRFIGRRAPLRRRRPTTGRAGVAPGLGVSAN